MMASLVPMLQPGAPQSVGVEGALIAERCKSNRLWEACVAGRKVFGLTRC